MSDGPSLEGYAQRLREAAAALRDPDLPEERAAALVEECARLAAEAGSALDRAVRAAAER